MSKACGFTKRRRVWVKVASAPDAQKSSSIWEARTQRVESLNLKDQYRPAYGASEHPPLDWKPSACELDEAFRTEAKLASKLLDWPR